MQHKHCSQTEHLSDVKDIKLRRISQIFSEAASTTQVQAQKQNTHTTAINLGVLTPWAEEQMAAASNSVTSNESLRAPKLHIP